MLNRSDKAKLWKIIAAIILFFCLLTSFRILWTSAFQNLEQPHALNGVLDLRNWDMAEQGTLSLDGEWEFYPYMWLSEQANEQWERDDAVRRYTNVPGGWNASLNPGNEAPYGYGSYRLRILIDPEQETTYSIRVPSVRSASELFVNGRLLVRMGQPGIDRERYVAGNIPYTASFAAPGNAIIEVVVQAANFNDPRESGIIRSMKFGTENAIDKQTQLSVSMQLIMAVVFLTHSIYAIILYVLGTRDRRLLYFSVLTFSAMFSNMLGSDEKILHYWFPISYEWGFKLIHLSMIVVAYSLFQCFIHKMPGHMRKVSPWYGAVCGIAALLALLLRSHHILEIQLLFICVTAASVLITMVMMLRISIKELHENVLMLLSFIAFTNHFVWWGIYMALGIKVIYYPVDLVLSTACFASLWFRQYFQVHMETKRLAAKLQKADKQKDEFLANTSHELRNPLHGIINMSQVVLERERNVIGAKSVKDLETVLSIGRRMSLTLGDLLDVMSLKGNAPRLHLQSLSIHTVATGVLDMLHFMTEGKPVQIVNRIPHHFPHVIGDENRVIQIVFNLLHNAVKFTNEGEIAILAREKDGKAFITVSDTGIGMDAESIRRVFEPYEQAYSRQTMIEGGFGLGLSISRQLAELHGETLEAVSVPGRGSEFTFTLPLSDEPIEAREMEGTAESSSAAAAQAISAEAADARESIPAEPNSQPADRPRILIVDDDPVNLNVIESILSSERYDIATVTSGSKALAELALREWDLVISDVMMPQMSGYELTRVIRERFTITELPILLLTARSQPEDIENGFRSGANDYVTKPVDALELRTRVKALTDARQSVRERLRMEAAWLQAQIQPHFLFNTLNAITALSEIDMDRMRKLLDVFGNFLRNKFKFENMDELVLIEDELSIVRSYLYIEKERFEDRLSIKWEIDDCRSLRVPMLTIQPLVENAIRHGVMERARGGQIVIRVVNYSTYAEIIVEDDGIGMDENLLQRIPERKAGIASGVGLLNTDLRLKRHFGRGLAIKSVPGGGTSISFIVYRDTTGAERSDIR